MKFFALVIMPNLKLQRIWVDEAAVLQLIKEHKGCKVYRSSTDQEAVVVEDKVMWIDVANVDKVTP